MAGPSLRIPQVDLRVGGKPLPDVLAQGLTGLRVHQHLSLPSACELSFTGVEETLALQWMRAGESVDLALRGAGPALFEGRISAVEVSYGSDRIARVAVRAYDALLALRNRQPARAFVGLNAADLAAELVADLGLAVHCEEPGPAWPRVLQAGTDFELLSEICERCGLHFAVRNGALWLYTLRGHGPPLTLTLGDNLFEARFEANAHGAARSVGQSGWDPWRGGEHSAQADSARSGRDAALQPAARDVGGGDTPWLPGRCLQGDEQALALAQAELDRRGAQALVLWGTAAGDARLRPGARVRLAGVAAVLAGEHVLCSVRHTLDAERGFQSELSTALPAPRPRPAGCVLAMGLVTRIDDPQRLGRVQVALPAHGNVESDWLQVLAVGAGQGKGLVAQPDVGDRVLLLAERNDLAQAVVLGSLWGEAGLPEGQGGLGERASFCFVTPGGHRLRLDDGARSLCLQGSNGSRLEMAPDHVRLHANAPLTLESPGQTLTISARFINFERG